MKRKGLIVLPLVATMLGGCNILGFELPSMMDMLDPLGLFHEKEGGGGKVPAGAIDKRGQEEILGYRRVDSPKAGKKYLFGYYDTAKGQMRFANGNYHSDDKGEYPYYLGTTENTAEGAAEFELTSVGNSEYTVKVTCDSSKPWNNKMLALYEAQSSYSNLVMSIAPVNNLDDQYSYGDKTYDVVGRFKYYNTVNVDGDNYTVNTIGMEYQYVDNGETEKVLRMFGCEIENDKGGYVSIDCSVCTKCILDTYAIAHLYEKI